MTTLLHKLWQLTKHFRWPLAGALVMLLALYWWLQPRVREEVQLSAEAIEAFGNSNSIKVSPSGKYLLCFDMVSGELHLYEKAGKKLVFKQPCLNELAFGFDNNDGLLFCSRHGYNHTVNFWHWLPGVTEARKVAEHVAYLYQGESTGRPNPSEGCLLSPDANTWFIQAKDKDFVHFSLIDAHIGQESARLDLPAANLKKAKYPLLQAAFSADSKTLVTQVKFILEGDRVEYELTWFDVATGKRLKSSKLTDGLSIDEIGILTHEVVGGILEENNQHSLQLYSDAQGYQRVPITDTMPELAEQSWPTAKDGVWRAEAEVFHRFDTDSNKMVYCWQHRLFPKTGGLGGARPFLPGYYYGVRDLSTGKLIHTERLPDRPSQPDGFSYEDWKMLGVLPCSVLVLRYPKLEPTAWQKTWEAWRSRYIPWFSAASSRNDSLLFLEATTGKRLAELETSLTHVKQFYHPGQQALYLAGQRNDQLVVQKYDYPLHKPWHIILAWVAGVFVVMAGVQWIKQRATRTPSPTT